MRRFVSVPGNQTGNEEIEMSVDSEPLNQPYPKLPLGRAISLSYSTYFEHFLDALRASWLWMLVVAAITGVTSWEQWSWMSAVIAQMKPGVPPQLLQPPAIGALLSLQYILLTLAGVSIAVAWHRRLILGEHPGWSGSNLATKNPWRYIGVGLAIVLTVMLPIIAIVVPLIYFVTPAQHLTPGPPHAAPFLLIPLVFVLYFVAVAIMLRLTLLLPARATADLDLTFRQTWNRTRGNTWRLFWGILATTIPPIALAEIAFLLIGGLNIPSGARNFAMIADADFARRMTAMSTIFMVYYLLMLPIGIGFLSHAYRHFFRTESGPVPNS
jgi:hypothetical protein